MVERGENEWFDDYFGAGCVRLVLCKWYIVWGATESHCDACGLLGGWSLCILRHEMSWSSYSSNPLFRWISPARLCLKGTSQPIEGDKSLGRKLPSTTHARSTQYPRYHLLPFHLNPFQTITDDDKVVRSLYCSCPRSSYVTTIDSEILSLFQPAKDVQEFF